jgi:uncharacterized membrane protein
MGFFQPSPEILFFLFYKANIFYAVGFVITAYALIFTRDRVKKHAVISALMAAIGWVVLGLSTFTPALGTLINSLSPAVQFYDGLIWASIFGAGALIAILSLKRHRTVLLFLHIANIGTLLGAWFIAY